MLMGINKTRLLIMVFLTVLFSVGGLVSCMFFPDKFQYYYNTSVVGKVMSYSWAEIDAEGTIFIADESSPFLRKWNESLDEPADYVSFDSDIEALEFDIENAQAYVLEGENLWDVDLSSGTKSVVDNSVDPDAQAIGVTTNYLVVGTYWGDYESISRANYAVADTVNLNIEADDYLFIDGEGTLLVTTDDDVWYGDPIMISVTVDQTTGAFGTPIEHNEDGVPLDGFSFGGLLLPLADEGQYLTSSGAIVLADGGGLGYHSNLSFENFEYSGWNNPVIRDACFFGDSLVTIETDYETTQLALRSGTAPYDETGPPASLELEFERVFPFGDVLYVFGVAPEGYGTGGEDIYKLDATIWD